MKHMFFTLHSTLLIVTLSFQMALGEEGSRGGTDKREKDIGWLHGVSVSENLKKKN